MHEIGSSSDPAAEMDTTQPRTWAELDATR